MNNLAATSDTGKVILDHMVAALGSERLHTMHKKTSHRWTSNGAKPCPTHGEGRKVGCSAILEDSMATNDAAVDFQKAGC